MKILIAGGTGFLGKALTDFFIRKGHHVVVLTRGQSGHKGNVRWLTWDGTTIGSWADELYDVEALINLTGKNVNCRYNESNKKEILRSRTDSVHVLSTALAQRKLQVPVWIQASSATIYRHAEDRPMTERDGEAGSGFSVDVCQAWEAAFRDVKEAKRKVVMRTAIVLGNEGGAWPLLRKLARFGCGGPMGSGRQYISWLHVSDFIKITEWLINEPTAQGTYNCSSPDPVTNYEFMNRVARIVRNPIRIPSPEWLLRIGALFIGTETELILKSRWVLPERLQDEGFQFEYPNLNTALSNLV